MTTLHSEPLPSYEQTVSHTQPPPDYYSVAAVSTQSPFHSLYTTHNLDLNTITLSTTTDTPTQSSDTQDLTQVSFNGYTPYSESSIEDLSMALSLSLKDKINQITLNTEFIQKRVKTRTPNQYIDGIRQSATRDFTRIKNRISQELSNIDTVFDSLMLHNAMFMEVDASIKALQSQIITSKSTNYLSKQEAQQLMDKMLQQLINRGRVVKNLELIQQHIARLSSDDDVSYVLKERAKIYNDAKELVRRQSSMPPSYNVVV